MKKEIISVPELYSYQSYGFEHGVLWDKLIFITGQRGIDKDGGVIADEIEAQTEATFKNIAYILKMANSDLSKLLSMTCFIVDIQKNGPGFWEMRKKMVPSHDFTSATIGIAQLADPKSLIEVQCIAYRP